MITKTVKTTKIKYMNKKVIIYRKDKQFLDIKYIIIFS